MNKIEKLWGPAISRNYEIKQLGDKINQIIDRLNSESPQEDKPKQESDWEKECLGGAPWTQEGRRLLNHIRSLLASSKTALLEEICEKLEKEKTINTKEESNSDWFYGHGYNQALFEVLTTIRDIMK